MRNFFLLLLFPFIVNAQNNSDDIKENDWLTDYANAQVVAKKTNSNILMYFTGSDWCSPCKALKKDLFDTSQFKEVAKDYVLLYVDLPRKKELLSAKEMQQNKALLSQWNKKGVFPLISLVNSEEKEVASLSGYGSKVDVEKYLDFLKRNSKM
ncbi:MULTISPECIES: thioredoxin family protein [Arenibacter]|jgi:thioredoxin-related protein|uniref:Disulfide bond reductase DsbH n=1 Tax=Arenibacter algicola TaxID=616991 RepID=A0A221V2V1_9FLAO|nr:MULTISPECIES: thioredoxin family protein [Arenibacter]ASO07919.1 disulfide bond reductase DsbH [Arenibacter algicola]MDX1759123.1 thioredoxin family protein [Arenibacter algicola]GBF19205.1 disulfide bond reductase DsbH precursor [Arenibacter sp. NBRC 103722]|tara:strand:+ start:185 stop:643 length:459 start_codon:yes stop_codon:yes gene_type:complete